MFRGLVTTIFLLVTAASVSAGTWDSIKGDIFGETPIVENSPIVTLSAPVRAEDAAIVPVEIRIAAGRPVESLTLVVDENPAPVAATFRFGPGRREIALSTRLRVDAYSNIRAVARTDDGRLHMATRFVKASGGCSAPALKDADQALARIGEMRMKRIGEDEAQVMIRHPNYSGLQMDQLTRHYIPAKFVSRIEVKNASDLVFAMDGGISLSEDPVIRFSWSGGPLNVRAEDTDGRTFELKESVAPPDGPPVGPF